MTVVLLEKRTCFLLLDVVIFIMVMVSMMCYDVIVVVYCVFGEVEGRRRAQLQSASHVVGMYVWGWRKMRRSPRYMFL